MQALSAESHPELSRMLAEKAAELGARLLPAFDSPSGGACTADLAISPVVVRSFQRRTTMSACTVTGKAPVLELFPCVQISQEYHISNQGCPCTSEAVFLKLPPARSPLTSAGVPYSDVNLRTGKGSMPAWGQISSLSEISSVSLEFTYLAR